MGKKILRIGGCDRTNELVPGMQQAAAERDAQDVRNRIDGELRFVAAISSACNESEYHSIYSRLIHQKSKVDMNRAELRQEDMARAGLTGTSRFPFIRKRLRKLIKRLVPELWDRMGWYAFHQNVINDQICHVLEQEVILRKCEIEALMNRITALETEVARLSPQARGHTE